MARRKAPEVSPEERERRARLYAEERRARLAVIEKARTEIAQAYLVEQGALVGGEGFLDRHARLDRYRKALLQASAPAYRPTPRQLQARPCPGISEEVDF